MSKFYAAQIKFDKHYLNSLTEDPESGVFKQNCKYHVALHPAQFTDFGQSIKDELNRKIASFQGLMLGYEHIKLQSALGTIGSDNLYIHVDIQANFFIFQPAIGMILKGVVTKTTKDHVGCLVHSTFNVSLPKPDDDDESWLGNQAGVQDDVVFKIIYADLNARLPYIRGELLSVSSSDETTLPLISKKSKKLNKKIEFGGNNDEEGGAKLKSKKKHKKHNDLMENSEIKDEIVEEDEEVERCKKHKKKKKKKHDHNEVEEVLRKKEKHKEKKRKSEQHGVFSESLDIRSLFDDEHEHKERKRRKSNSISQEYLENFELEEDNENKEKLHDLIKNLEIKRNVKKEEAVNTVTKLKKKHNKNDDSFENVEIKMENPEDEEVIEKKNKHKKHKKQKLDYEEEEVLRKKERRKEKKRRQEHSSLESLDIKTLFDGSSMGFSTNPSQAMANNDDRGKKRRKSNSVSQEVYLENIKLEEDSELEKMVNGTKRRRSKSTSH